WPGTLPGRPHPSRTRWRSVPQMPQWLTSRSTSRGPTSGTGSSCTEMSPGPRYTAASMVAGTSAVTNPLGEGEVVGRGLEHHAHAPHACTTSSPRRVASQKGLVSSWTKGRGWPSIISGPAQEERARRHALAARDETGRRTFHLACGGAAQLAHSLGDEVEAVDVGLGHAAARGVHRQRTVGPLDVPFVGERASLASFAEPVALERQRHERAEGVVELGHVDVG